MRIGTFIAADGGYAGHLHTLTLDIDLVLVPADPSDSENAFSRKISIAVLMMTIPTMRAMTPSNQYSPKME